MPLPPSDLKNSSRKPSAPLPGPLESSSIGNTSGHGRKASGVKLPNNPENAPNPLVSSKLGNIKSMPNADDVTSKQKPEHGVSLPTSQASVMDQILAKLSPKDHPSNTSAPSSGDMRAKSFDQQNKSKQHFGDKQLAQKDQCTTSGEKPLGHMASGGTAGLESPNEADIEGKLEQEEMLRLQQELKMANSRIAMQEQELAQTRVIKHTIDQAMGPPSEVDFGGREITEQTISSLQSAFNASTRPFNPRQDTWVTQDDANSDISDALSAGGYNRARGLWNNSCQSTIGVGLLGANDRGFPVAEAAANPEIGRGWASRPGHPSFSPPGAYVQNQRMFSGQTSPPYGFNNNNNNNNQYTAEHGTYVQAQGNRRPVAQLNRGGSCFPPQNSPWGTFASVVPGTATPRQGNQQQMGPYQQQVNMFSGANNYQPRPIGTPLSPTAAEFTTVNSATGPWPQPPAPASNASHTYVSPLEPLNYRRLLDKSVSCDWKYIVDKIVCNNDQQASIFLQQKLKVGTAEQKYEIVEAIVNQAYPLMVNRFGNFLVQRCFEHGTTEQVISIANSVRGNTLSLSMDPFGCHVIQKAFDCVPEEHKAVMVHELLRRIPETVIHRYACHVWQKLFELRWSGEPPQIMAKVNEALRGMWHEVALGETGSLVVQNIFENCVEDEKRQAIEEVLAKIDLLAHGQFGNWCIQHICEHGAPHDKSRAIEHILLWATDYSMDQFASKVVEKCLKIGGSEFLERYLSRVCTGRPDRPRMPLIDIAGDQYGNYLIQWILLNASTHHRELVATHIRKHMVSLRGSKFGSRVAMLCCNPSHVTRPGPGAGIQVNRFNNPNPNEERFSSGMPGGRFNRGGGSQWSSNYPPFR